MMPTFILIGCIADMMSSKNAWIGTDPNLVNKLRGVNNFTDINSAEANLEG